MIDRRRSYLIQQHALGLLTAAERNELASMPTVVCREDGTPGMVLPPPLAGNTRDEKLADFARRFMFDDREATPDEVAAFVNGEAVVGTPNDQSPADQWADDADPGTPTPDAKSVTIVVADAQPATDPGTAADKLKDALQVVGTMPAAPRATERPVPLPPGYTFVQRLPDGRIVADFIDPSLPRSPARRVVLPDPAKVRGKENEHARRAAAWARTGEPNGGGRTVSR